MTPKQKITHMAKLLKTTIKLNHSNTKKMEANINAISNLTDRVDIVSRQMAELNAIAIDSMSAMKQMQSDMRQMQSDIRQMQSDMRQMQSDMRQMQSEIRGLQVENCQIMKRVFEEDSD